MIQREYFVWLKKNQYCLKFTSNAIAKLEQARADGISMLQNSPIQPNFTMSHLITATWAAMQAKHPGVSQDFVGDLLEVSELEEGELLALVVALRRAWWSFIGLDPKVIEVPAEGSASADPEVEKKTTKIKKAG